MTCERQSFERPSLTEAGREFEEKATDEEKEAFAALMRKLDGALRGAGCRRVEAGDD